ncbi:PREDICTED: inositol 1,4,5-trisphosphate receptor-interacting protein-like [Cyprinodon variegatus]|uniref:inositol 1,4,5-trisphosphate receptor-interacting protein-like n=1 Tax=Cyprinodon variegatus TaxID=28743 RepID=UPI0007427B52|nr:PREDICTED: inositol 1,4,5-trisphosphate receptor-interacting protein-like [Cyprinodon variegatus]
MEGTLLRVFLVAAGLLLCPRDNPGVEEWDDAVNIDLQRHNDMQLKGEGKLDQTSSESSKLTGPVGDINNNSETRNQSEQHETDKTLDSDVAVGEKDTKSDSFNIKIQQGDIKSKSDTIQPSEDINSHEEGEDISEQDSLHERDVKPEEAMTGSKEEESPASNLYSKTENETSEKDVAEWESDYLWYIWNTFSIISVMRFFRKYLQRNVQTDLEGTRIYPCRPSKVPLPDVETLQNFYVKFVQASTEKMLMEKDFLEGFAHDLFETMRSICDNDGSMGIEDFKMINEHDIIVYFTPLDPYSFCCALRNNLVSDPLFDMQVCGQIKLLKKEKILNGCPCQSANADDMVCLLHSESDKVKTKLTDAFDGPLCSKNTPFLSQTKVTRWFQATIKQAWAQISHKYEFELSIRYVEAPGALVIRFRSGRKIYFSLKPVVKFNNEAHFCIMPWSSSKGDTFWPLSLYIYEDRLLEHLAKRLPVNSCHNQTLEIAFFLHRRQKVLTGKTALKDFHFKTALIHLLLTKKPSQWQPNFATCRLQDLLSLVEESLKRKHLPQVLIGNPLAQVIELPKEISKAKPVNLFHLFKEDDCVYKNAVMHFQEMIKNAHMLIHEYVAQPTSSTKSI